MANPAPFLRWAGGKRQLLPSLLAALPADFDFATNRFFEPFFGGGALAFALSGHRTAPTAAPRTKTNRPMVLNDVNDELITTYLAVRDDVEGLIGELLLLQTDTSSRRYYEVRATRPIANLDRATRFIFLNKLSFNGLWRVNSKGDHNVPFGKVAKPVICDVDQLRACSHWLQQAEIRRGPYVSAVTDAKAGDVVYFDPPYLPLTTTASFSKYAKDDFKEMDQWALAGVIRGLVSRDVRIILSNSNTEMARRIYDDGLELRAISASRSIGADAASRSRVEEILGLSYPLADATDAHILAALEVADPATRSLPAVAA